MRRSALVKVPSFSRKVAAGQEDVGVVGGLVEEQVLHHDAFHGRQARGDVWVLGSDCRMSSPWM